MAGVSTLQDGVGPVVSMVYEGSHAAMMGVAAGDVVIATSASVGRGMWPKNTVAGVESAIQTRIDGQVRLRLRRSDAAAAHPPIWKRPLLHTYEVELRRPLGLVLRQREGDTGLLGGIVNVERAGVEVANVSIGGSAHASGAIRAGDLVVATSGTVGDALWEKSSLEGVLAAISTRLALLPTVRLRLERWQTFGPWAQELHEIACGDRRILSLNARRSLLAQRREWRDGVLAGEVVDESLRDLAAQAAVRCGTTTGRDYQLSNDARKLSAMARRLRTCGLSLDNRLATVGMSAALRLDDPELALNFFDTLHQTGGKADTNVYTTLIKAHAAAGRVSEALAVEQRMSAEKVPLSVRTYNTLMAVCARTGDRRGMLKYFSAISELGKRPNVESWNVVLDYAAKAQGPNRVLRTEDVLRRMRTQGITPDAVSYSCLAHACISSGQMERCEELIGEMAADGVVVSAHR